MEHKLKIGDLVKLKSGGVLMTAGHIKDSACVCNWFNDGVLKSALFDMDCLELFTPNMKCSLCGDFMAVGYRNTPLYTDGEVKFELCYNCAVKNGTICKII